MGFQSKKFNKTKKFELLNDKCYKILSDVNKKIKED